jgi:hypothetical protein
MAPEFDAELETTITRQDHVTSHGCGTARDEKVPFNAHASDVRDQLRAVVVSWARLIHEERGDSLPTRDEFRVVCAWLEARVHFAEQHPAGADMWREITDAVRDARRCVDRPADVRIVGVCPGCGSALYVRPGASRAWCGTVGCAGNEQPVETDVARH